MGLWHHHVRVRVVRGPAFPATTWPQPRNLTLGTGAVEATRRWPGGQGGGLFPAAGDGLVRLLVLESGSAT
ncbi:hypothetical protein VFPFJ_10777 [Purpureocillium lilacinum]|uniref:Uncharacterized protein n=1 Tax=Purpureocillium lilacinum TaxID=33203 RepID=A0A179GD84_PURLI|nr:hypothetical protein VFPFJ_10777 [Purpureocillium lilacinum]OAQ75787.1 hypothetical protein VFPFJ_10777 [Purpureocillium lilacinum]